ncbi:MAG: transcription elongation factor GreA [Erysipelotrichia bacterium]|jgi:transcription elongation factor GreA|nr:transcription elongation factor GreA [Erysipelotrichia bacterium]
MTEKVKLTKTGYQKLQEELRDLIDNQRAEIKVQLAEARAQGDLSENADYDAARTRQAEVEGRIIEIEGILNWCEVIEDSPKNSKKIGLGSIVKIKIIASGEIETYMITGTTEADPIDNKISNICPLGMALIGKKVGDVVDVKTKVPYNVEVIEISINK